jgi:hypothetical protein
MPSLTADCSRCCGLCCIVPAYLRTQGFPVDKPAGKPCMHLSPEHRCVIHARRAELGFAACAGFDCHGAGQWITAKFAASQWRSETERAQALAEAYRYWLPRFRIAAMLQAARTLVDDESQQLLRDRSDAILDPAGELAGATAAALERDTVALLRRLVRNPPTGGSFPSTHPANQ